MATIAFLSQADYQVDSIREIYNEHSREYEKNTTDRQKYDFSVYVANTYKDVPEAALQSDIIIARGLLAAQLRQAHPTVSIVEIPISSELVTSVHQAVQQYGHVPMAVVGSFNVALNIQGIDSALGVQLKIYLQFSNEPEEIDAVLDRIVADGFKVIICGANTFRHAEQRRLQTVLIGMSRESIWWALSEAKHSAVLRRRERERAEQFRTVLNYAAEGVIATDMSGRIQVFNDVAAEITGVDNAIGRDVGDIIPRGALSALLRSQNDCTDRIVSHKGELLSVNKVSVLLQGDFSGHVITLQKSSAIQKTEGKIRRELYAKGHIARYTFDDIIGNSPAIEFALQDARKYAAVTSNILLVGDTGTGKEMFAQGIHNQSARRSAPFVAINCAALSKSLLESELFGYVEGAFTGAAKGGKPGIFEIAHTGTIFLDEVSEIPMDLQGRLLRVLQERQIMRLGDDKVIPIDVRIISATNKDLLPEVQQNTFRRDLYYRLNVLSLALPTLNQRGSDILRIAASFIEELCNKFQRPRIVLTDELCASLMAHTWDGNIRELRNVCERLVVLTEGETIARQELDRILATHEPKRLVIKEIAYSDELRDFDREKIRKALDAHGGNKALAAKKLGMSKSTLFRRIKTLGIEA